MKDKHLIRIKWQVSCGAFAVWKWYKNEQIRNEMTVDTTH